MVPIYNIKGGYYMEELNLDQFLADVSSENIDSDTLALSNIAVSW